MKINSIQSKTWLIIGIIALALAVSLGTFLTIRMHNKNAREDDEQNTQVLTTNDQTSESSETAEEGTDAEKKDEQAQTGGTPTTQTSTTFFRGHGYDKTLTSFQTSRYLLQFDGCSISPYQATQTVPKSVKFAVMNSGKNTVLYSVFGIKFKLATGDYAVLSSAKPGTYSLTCEGANRAKVIIAK